MKTNPMQSLLNNIESEILLKSVKQFDKSGKNNINISEILKDKNIQTLLKDLASDLINNNKSAKVVLDILKNEPIFKEFNAVAKELKSLISVLKKMNFKSETIVKLNNLLTDINKVDNKILKQDVLNNTKIVLTEVVKDLAEQTDVAKQVNKLLSQVEYYSLLSLSNYSNHTYLPFNWDELEDGDINFKQNDEDNFSCQIILKLKYYGDMKINILFDKSDQLSISFFIQQDNLKEKLQDSLKILRIKLKDIGVKIQNIYIFDLLNNQDDNIKVYSKYDNHIGIDITA